MGGPSRNKLQYYLSFLFDAHIESRSSKFNEVLDVKYYEGSYLLDAKTANFSFGTLHRVFQLVFDKINVQSRPVESALILGYGCGSITELLRERLTIKRIVGVEIDAEVIDIARIYFDLDSMANVSIVEMDAEEYVKKGEEKFDLVAVDLFDDDKVPIQFYSSSFLNRLKQTLKSDGILVFNVAIIDSGQAIKDLMVLFEEIFPGNEMHSIEANKVMVWKNTI